jgi:hypothetical protein
LMDGGGIVAGWVVMSPLLDGFRAMGVAVLADAGARCTHPTVDGWWRGWLDGS